MALGSMLVLRHRVALLAAIVLVTGLGAPRSGEARSRKSTAKRHFDRGEDHYNAGEFRKALQSYQKAYKAYDHPAFLFNIAQCYRQLHRYEKAAFFYRLYLDKRPKSANRAEVLRRISEMDRAHDQAKLKRIQGKISVVTEPDGAEVRVDEFKGPPLDTTPATLVQRRGDHVVLIRKKGYHPVQRRVRVQAGRIAVLKVTLVSLRSTRPAVPVYAPIHHRWWFWTGIGVAVTAGALTGYFGSAALKAHDDYLLDGTTSSRNKADRWALAADITVAGGAAVAIATIVTAIVVHRRGKRHRRTERAVTVTPSCGANRCGLWVRGSF